MNIPDLFNGAFETLGGVSVWAHARRIKRDKMVRGFSPAATAFMAVWGVWNLYYYPQMGQWASFAGGLVIVAGNTVWLFFALKYDVTARVSWLSRCTERANAEES